MKLLTGLFRAARKRLLTADNDMGAFRDKLTELVEKKDSLPDEEVAERVEELKGMTKDLPDDEGKAQLDRFLEDFKSVKEQDEATAKEAVGMVADLFEKLDTEAMKDAPEAGGEEKETVEKTATETSETPANASTEETAKETVEETVAPEGKETKDDGNSDYTLEEIYQFIKKRMAEDSCAGDSGEEVKEEKKEEEKEEVVTDRAPRIPVTMNGTAAKGSLAEMFQNIKKGGR